MILAIFSGLIYLFLQSALVYGWYKPVRQRDKNAASFPVSVIVAAHNEAENLPRLLESLSQLNYPEWELVLVLDRCTDESVQVIAAWKSKLPLVHLVKITQTPAGWSPKKWAIEQGVATATHEHLLLTDADCRVQPDWISAFAQSWTHEEVLIGLGPYEQAPGWLNKIIRWETFSTALLMAGMARLNMPYMAVGRNLAYRKSFFQRNEGLVSFAGQLSGDDDLLVNAFAQPESTSVVLIPGSWTFSLPKTTWRSWFLQKMRHVSGSAAYTVKSKLWLALFHGSHFLFYFGLIILSFEPLTAKVVFPLYLLRLAISWYLTYLVNKKIREPNLLTWFPVLDLFTLIYNLSIIPLGLILPPRWKK